MSDSNFTVNANFHGKVADGNIIGAKEVNQTVIHGDKVQGDKYHSAGNMVNTKANYGSINLGGSSVDPAGGASLHGTDPATNLMDRIPYPGLGDEDRNKVKELLREAGVESIGDLAYIQESDLTGENGISRIQARKLIKCWADMGQETADTEQNRPREAETMQDPSGLGVNPNTGGDVVHGNKNTGRNIINTGSNTGNINIR